MIKSSSLTLVGILLHANSAIASCSVTGSLAGNWQFFSEGLDAMKGTIVECTLSLTGNGALLQGACRHRYYGAIKESFALSAGKLAVNSACAVTGSFSYVLTGYKPRSGETTTPIETITISTARMDKSQSAVAGIAWNRDEFYYSDLRDGTFTMVAY